MPIELIHYVRWGWWRENGAGALTGGRARSRGDAPVQVLEEEARAVLVEAHAKSWSINAIFTSGTRVLAAITCRMVDFATNVLVSWFGGVQMVLEHSSGGADAEMLRLKCLKKLALWDAAGAACAAFKATHGSL